MIWILSWSWPEAWIHITKQMHLYLQKKHNAVQDTDYPKYILYNAPLTSFNETWIIDNESVKKEFLKEVDTLVWMWVSILWVACNTLHKFYDDIEQKPWVAYINLLDEVSNHCHQEEIKSVLLLSSSTTNKEKLYIQSLIDKWIWIVSISDNNQKEIDNCILTAMAWKTTQKESSIISSIIQKYSNISNFEAVVLWCTELPLCYEKESFMWKKIISSNKVLAISMVEKKISIHYTSLD